MVLFFLVLFMCPLAYGMEQKIQKVSPHTPLVQAALEANLEVVTKLLDAGAQVNEIALSGIFPLYAVVQAPLAWDNNMYPTLDTRYAVIKLLLSRGADFQQRTTDELEETVFHAATRLAPGGARKILLGSLMITNIITSIVLTQSPLVKAFKAQPPTTISEEETKLFKDTVWKALLIKNKADQTSIDLMCNKSCPASSHYECVATGFTESLISDTYDSELECLQSKNS